MLLINKTYPQSSNILWIFYILTDELWCDIIKEHKGEFYNGKLYKI